MLSLVINLWRFRPQRLAGLSKPHGNASLSTAQILSWSAQHQYLPTSTTMSSSIVDTKSALERCLELLKPGTSDESKFIGLTLMSDVLQSTQDLDTMTRFFESMDFEFLDRMMQIGKEGVTESVFLGIGRREERGKGHNDAR